MDIFLGPFETRRCVAEGADGERLKRAFCQFIWEPINQMFDAVMSDKVEKYSKMLTSLGIKLSSEDKGFCSY